MECAWKKQKTPDVTCSVAELYPTPRDYNPLEEELGENYRASFYNDLKLYGQFTGLGWIPNPEPKKETLIPVSSVEGIITSEDFLQSD